MKKLLILLFSLGITFVMSGCATWEGVKKDSSKAWEATKEASQDAYDSAKEAVND